MSKAKSRLSGFFWVRKDAGHHVRARGALRPIGRAGLGLLLLVGTFSSALVLSITGATPAFAATPTYTCSTPAAAGTSTTWVVGVANSTNITCYGVSGVSGTTAYPASITLNSGTLPAGSTEATSTSSSPACTTTTSGSGTTEEYELLCAIADTPTAAAAATPLTFSVAPGTDGGTGITSGTLNLTVANPGTPTCIDPAAAGASASFVVGAAAEYTVECENTSGVSGTAAYPTSITVASGTGPSDGSLTMPTTYTSGTAPASCTHGTSGTGATEEYILECELNGTTTPSDIGSYPYTFTATNAAGVTATSGTLTVNVVAATVTCIDPASGGTSSTFYEGSTNSYTVECESQSGTSGVSAYPSSIAVASGALPADGNPTFATSTSSSPACTHGTSGSGATEEYILECALADTPTGSDAGSYPLTFTATGAGGAGTTTSGTLTVNVQPPTTACSAPAAAGTATTFTDGTAGSYTVICYSEGYATAASSNYPTSITLHSGTLPADVSEATTTSSSPACTTATSGSGVTEEYELECKIAQTPASSDNGSYPVTFSAVGGLNAPTTTSGTWTLTDAGTKPSFPADQYTDAESGQPFCYQAIAGSSTSSSTSSLTVANGGLPLTNVTLGAAPAGVTNWHLGSINLNTGVVYACGTEGSAAGNSSSFSVTFTNSGGSATGTIDLYTYASTCGWTSTTGTVSEFNAAEDTYQNGSQSAFGQPITNGETKGTTKNEPSGCTDSAFYAPGFSGGAFTVNTANPLPGPTDTNPSAAQGDLASSNLDLTTGSNGSVGGCYGDAVIDIAGGEESGSFGSASQLTIPSNWVNGGDCSYGSLGSNSAGGNTDTTNASCPPSQADVNAGYVSCSITASTGNDDNASYNNTSMDIFFNGQPVPQQPQATLSIGNAQPGDTVTVTGGADWWGNSGGAPNSGPYGDDQVGEMYPVAAPSVFIGTSRGTAVPVVNSTVTINANSYVCTGAESTTVGPNPCTMTPGQPSGTFQVPSGLAPGAYNIYIDETNTTPLPGNGPNDAYQTTQGTNLGTAESATQLNVEGLAVVKTSTTSAYGSAGQTLSYNYAVTDTGPDTLTGIQVSDNLIPSANISCPSTSLTSGSTENCTGSYTTTQADVDNGYVTNTATVSGLAPNNEAVSSAPSSATVYASNATSTLSLAKSTTSTGYGAAGNTISYSYLVTNSGTTTETNVGVTDNRVSSVSCPSSKLAPGASETCTGTYTVTQADVDAGSVTNTAFATGTNPQAVGVDSTDSTVTVEASNATSSLGLTKSTTSTGYGAAGNTISYSYLVTNTGTTTESDVGVNDNLIANVSCPDSTLAPGASETCTGTYTVTQSDVDAGSVTNTASATATGPYANAVSSATTSVTVEASQATSTLTLSESTTSTGYGRAGNTINYSFLVSNTGTTTLSSVGVSDDEITSVSCPDSSLAPAASETCTGTHTVTQSDVDAGSVTDSATASATSPPSASPVSSNTTSITVEASAAYGALDVSVSTTSTGYGKAGDTIPYSYQLTNDGTDTLSNLGVSDDEVATVSCPDSSLAPGDSEICAGTHTVTQADVDAGSVTDSAAATGTNSQDTTVTSATSSVTVEASNATSSLSISKSTTSTGYGKAGDTIGYKYLVTNTGTTTLSSVGVSDNLIPSISCPDASLAPSASETCTGTYTVTQADVDAGSVTNVATASADNPQNNSVSSGSSTVTVDASKATSSLSLTKATTSSGYGAAGDTIPYTYLVKNTGSTTLSGIGVSDNKVTSVSCPNPSSLAPNASETCTGTYTVTQANVDAGSVTNTATATATNPYSDGVTSNSSSVTVEASNATSSLSLTKATTSTGYGAAGDTIPYTYLVKNTGTTTLSGVGVTDNKVSSVSCSYSSLAPGASETCTGTYTVTLADVNAGSVTNTATAHATNPHATAVTSASSSVTVLAAYATSSLSITETAVTTSYHATGNVIHYDSKVTNTGSTTVSDITVTDTKATGLKCPDSSLNPAASETCTGSYTVTQADVSHGSVVNTATVHGISPKPAAVTSAKSSATVHATGLRITTASPLPVATRNDSYSTQLAATGGTSPYTWYLTSGSLPKDLRMSSSGAITGKALTAGTYTITVEVKAANSATATGTFTIKVAA